MTKRLDDRTQVREGTVLIRLNKEEKVLVDDFLATRAAGMGRSTFFRAQGMAKIREEMAKVLKDAPAAERAKGPALEALRALSHTLAILNEP